MKHDGMFLAKVKVKRFAESRKGYGPVNGQHQHTRGVVTVPNRNPDEIFTVIGVTQLKEGWSDYIGYEEGYAFRETGSKQVYIVAKSIGQRFKALPEDIELLTESSGSDASEHG